MIIHNFYTLQWKNLESFRQINWLWKLSKSFIRTRRTRGKKKNYSWDWQNTSLKISIPNSRVCGHANSYHRWVRSLNGWMSVTLDTYSLMGIEHSSLLLYQNLHMQRNADTDSCLEEEFSLAWCELLTWF